MDIRDFFKVKKSLGTKKKVTTTATESIPRTKDDSSGIKSKAKRDNAMKVQTAATNTSSSDNFQRKTTTTTSRAKPSTSSSSSTTTSHTTKRQNVKAETPKKRKQIIIKSDTETEEEKEISPQDFFASSHSKQVSSTSPKKKAAKLSPQQHLKPQEEVVVVPVVRKESLQKVIRTEKKRMREEDDDDSNDDDHNSLDDTDKDGDDEYNDVDHNDDDFQSDDDDDDIEEDYEPPKKRKSPVKSSRPPKKTPVVKKQSPAKKTRKSPAKKVSTQKESMVILEPTLDRDSFDVNSVQVPEFMAGITFVFTGNMDNLGRDDAIDLVKTLGGRVTTAVSGKTNYLVIGEILEDGRDYTEGSKYRKATTILKDKVKLVMGEKKLYGLCHLYHEKAMKAKGIDPKPLDVKEEQLLSILSAADPSVTPSNHTDQNPIDVHAKKIVPNPYAKANPYAKPASGTNPYAKRPSTGSNISNNAPTKQSESSSKSVVTYLRGNNDLWVDRYKPTSTRDILGNKTNVTKLQNWLKSWEKTFLNSKATGKTFSNPKGPWKAALLSGPPGIGKTTTAMLVSQEDGRHVMEFNASDARSKKTLQTVIGEVTESQGISFLKNTSKQVHKPQKRVVIMDEVDGMGAGDRSGMSELIQMIKRSKVPIICICNDRQSQKMKSLLPYCMDLRFSRPTKNILANRAIRIAQEEHLLVERNAAEAIAESCGNDVRQVLNLLQMWAQKKDSEGNQTLTYSNLKERGRSVNKDEILRVGLFDAAKLIMEGRVGLSQADDKANVDNFFKRNDAFFVDYSLTGLLVQQNYPRIIQGQYLRGKQQRDPVAEQELLERLHKAAESMSDYNLVENKIRGGDNNWSLLPSAAALVVKCGYHTGGENGGMLGGYPEFSAWMGKNSTAGKNFRLLSELNHHMNFRVSANSLELRQTYIPILRKRILTLLKQNHEDAVKEAIALMDDYGLNREDIAEKLDTFVLGKKVESFEDLDSKQKAAFTREYNAGSHMQQALVQEQGGGPIKSRRSGTKEKEPVDLDAIDEDDVVDDEESDFDEEKELTKLQEKFKRKKSKAKSTTKKGEPAPQKKVGKTKKK